MMITDSSSHLQHHVRRLSRVLWGLVILQSIELAGLLYYLLREVK